jgi:hypothetical protein
MTAEERAELKTDMVARVGRGLDPLEHPILLYEQQILDGRHRYQAWLELAAEDPGGFFTRHAPPTETYSAQQHGHLGAFLRAKSRNLVHRHIPADQKAAILLKAAESYPEVKAALGAIREENLQRQRRGKPLGAGDRRGSTAEQVGDLVGVGPTTVKQVRRLQKQDPEHFERVARGEASVRQALKAPKEKEAAPPNGESNSAAARFQPGDTIYLVEDYRPGLERSPRLRKLVVSSVEEAVLVCGGERVASSEALTLDAAKERRTALIKALIRALQKELLLKSPAIIEG